MRVAVIGAGILGRTLYCYLSNKRYYVNLFEQNSLFSFNCSYAAAGLLAPYAESVIALPSIATVGQFAINFWATNRLALSRNFYFSKTGTLCIADRQYQQDLKHFANLLLKKYNSAVCTAVMLEDIEPELASRYEQALYLPLEAQVCTQQLMSALTHRLRNDPKVHPQTPIGNMHSGKLSIGGTQRRFDWLIDCRGLAAKNELENLRGVRGELLHVYAPAVELRHVIRLFHPRYPVYILPRPRHRFVIGASSIETEDHKPITVKTTLELLSAAVKVHAGFMEATVIKSVVNCRPAFDDNQPRIEVDEENKVIRINGLYRHGYLYSPFFAAAVEHYFNRGYWQEEVNQYIHAVQ